MEHIYIVVHNNGLSYEDKDHWIAYVNNDKEKAIEYGKNNLPFQSWYFTIEIWKIGEPKKIGYLYFEKKLDDQFSSFENLS